MRAALARDDITYRDTAVIIGVALLARLTVVLWGANRFVPVADGVYYHRLAVRIAQGQGYTWQWPDGAITYAAHYPVGYPAMLSIAYRLAGSHPMVAAGLNTVLGVAGVGAMHRLAVRAMSRTPAVVATLLHALDPTLVFYTVAVMTEGVAASLLSIAAWVTAEAREAVAGKRVAALALLALVLGVATLVRPQCLLLAPFFGACAALPLGHNKRTRQPTPQGALRSSLQEQRQKPPLLLRVLLAMLGTTLGALTVCLPWTLRNCTRMGRCALVSVNSGWNLLIGAEPNTHGSWAPLQAPAACRGVFDEAAKDVCFERVARSWIAHNPWAWLRGVPAKLSATFDYAGSASWYLHESNPVGFPHGARVALGAVETAFHRVVVACALLALARGQGPHRTLRLGLALIGIACALGRPAFLAYLALLGILALRAPALARLSTLTHATVCIVGATALVHAVFFGASRYSLVVYPFVTVCAGALLTWLPPWRDTPPRHAPD